MKQLLAIRCAFTTLLMNSRLVGVAPINYKIKHASAKMFSLPYGSRSRVCPDRLLQNRSDTAGRFYSYDILKNCTFARGKQCTICSVVYCKRREYVVLFLIRKMDSIFGGEFEVYSLFYFECVFRWNIKHKIILKTNAQA